MSLQARLQNDLNDSRKKRNAAATLLISTTIADTRNREIELKRALKDEDVVEVIQRGIKKRREAQELFEKGGRAELAAKEGAEIRMLQAYHPAQASAEEIRAAVKAAIGSGAANVGAVMGQVMPLFRGKADGAVISTIVREELGGK